MQGKEQRLLSRGQNGKTFPPLLFLCAPSCFFLIQDLNPELLGLKTVEGIEWSVITLALLQGFCTYIRARTLASWRTMTIQLQKKNSSRWRCTLQRCHEVSINHRYLLKVPWRTSKANFLFVEMDGCEASVEKCFVPDCQWPSWGVWERKTSSLIQWN